MSDVDIARLDAALMDVFGEAVSYTPSGGSPVSIVAMFQEASEEITFNELDVEINGPTLCVLLEDIADPTTADLVTARGVDHRVKNIIRDEGAFSFLVLEEV